MGYTYILLTIFFTAYGQLILKWRLGFFNNIPNSLIEKLLFLTKLLIDPYIFSSFISAFIGSLTWMAALRDFELSKAYPLMSFSYVIVMILSVSLLNETFNLYKLLGSILVIVGIIIISKG